MQELLFDVPEGDTLDMVAPRRASHFSPKVKLGIRSSQCPAAGVDEAALVAARQALVDCAGDLFMIDAAAVVANFEMMTRVADGTGARFAEAGADHRAAISAKLHIDDFTSAH